MIRTLKSGLYALGLLLLAIASPALADAVYPFNNPTYIPAAISPQATIPIGTTSLFAFQTNGVSTLYLRIAGSPSGLAATVQGTEARQQPGNAAPTWTALPIDIIGGVRVASISGTGLFRINVSGFAQVRLNVSALTSGATTVTMSAGQGLPFASGLPQTRATYSAASLIGTGATTHFLVIAGSATKTVRILHAECSGVATGALGVTITAELDSAADSVDAGTALTAVPNDSTDVAASATIVKHTTSPTSGALIGLVRAGSLVLATAGTPVTNTSPPLAWDFGVRPGEQEIILRGVAQQFALNTNAAFGTGASVGCAATWTEE